MTYIEEVRDPAYEAEVGSKRGRVANILRIHGIEPGIGRGHLALYMAIQFGPSAVSRLDREAIAVAIPAANRCPD